MSARLLTERWRSLPIRMIPVRKSWLFNSGNQIIVDLPAPTNLSSWWSFGSMLGVCLLIQIITGLLLAFRYCPDAVRAFDSVISISRDVPFGWLIRRFHANGARLFFLFIYCHIGRGFYYGSLIDIPRDCQV